MRDFAQVAGKPSIDSATVSKALDLQVDQRGLDGIDRKMLLTMINYYHGGPVGLKTIAANIGEETNTIEEMYEPYLLQIGFISRTPAAGWLPRLPTNTWGSVTQRKNEGRIDE